MTYYRTCPICGANLDPGEVCEDCRRSENEARPKKEKAAPGATNTQDGKTRTTLHDSALIVPGGERDCQV